MEQNNRRFLHSGSGYLNDISAEAFFEYRFNSLPSKIFIADIDKKIYELLDKEFGKPEIAHVPLKFNKRLRSPDEYFTLPVTIGENCEYKTFFYAFEYQCESFIIKTSENTESCNVEICAPKLETIFKLIKEFNIEKYKIQEPPLQIGILYQSHGAIMIKKIPLPEIEVNLEYNYGSDFVNIYDNIVNKLNNKSCGLYILYGTYGVGKTSLIKHLAKTVNNRMFVFVPTNQLEALVTPALLPILLEHKNIVLILEDAEKAIESREISNTSQSMVSTILNLSDGILGSLLNLAIIVTFNTKREKIDEALLRKGRLLVEHKFDKLSIKDSQRLLDYLKKDFVAKEEMTLAEIYNVDDNNFHKEEEEKQKIGF